jgi:hypothetical protein
MGPYLRNKGLLFWQIVPQLWGKTLVLFLALYTVLMLAGGVLHYFLQPQTPGFEWHQLSDGLALCLTAATVTSLAWFAYLHLYGPWKQGRVMQHPHLAPLRKAGFRLAMLPRSAAFRALRIGSSCPC